MKQQLALTLLQSACAVVAAFVADISLAGQLRVETHAVGEWPHGISMSLSDVNGTSTGTLAQAQADDVISESGTDYSKSFVPTTIPEPASLSLLLLGLAGAFRRRAGMQN